MFRKYREIETLILCHTNTWKLVQTNETCFHPSQPPLASCGLIIPRIGVIHQILADILQVSELQTRPVHFHNISDSEIFQIRATHIDKPYVCLSSGD